MPSHFLVQLNSVNAKPGLELTLSAERSNYLCRVLRLTHHDTLKCFDGHGLGFDAKLLDANPKAATISIVSLGSQQKKSNPRPAFGVEPGQRSRPRPSHRPGNTIGCYAPVAVCQPTQQRTIIPRSFEQQTPTLAKGRHHRLRTKRSTLLTQHSTNRP